jgi:tubulysin polyketide synthase-like protein
MNAIEVLTELRNAGIRVEPRPNGNLYLAPANRLTPDLLTSVRTHKSEILNLLSQPRGACSSPSDDATIARAKQIAQAAGNAHDLIDYGTRVGAVELIYVEPREKVTPVSPEFPPCPACATARYWISSLGKVVCSVCGETRFILASISYHTIN